MQATIISEATSSKGKAITMETTKFKKGDKFILELGDRKLDEFEIAGTDLYVRISLLKQLTPYKPDEEKKEAVK